jgi:hypothetical protein
VLLISVESPIHAQGGGSGSVTKPRPKDGKLVDRAPSKATVTVTPTDDKSKPLPFDGWPQTQSADANNPAVFQIPRVVFDKLGDAHLVYDVHQEIQILGNSGEISALSIESVFFDPTTSQFSLGNIFGTLADTVGVENEISIPDLFADTNGDGTLGLGDILYSLVDLNQYLTAVPQISFGEMFTVNNGTVSGLPGMMFSTDPFSFDPSTGFTGTLFNGTAEVKGIHGATAVIPEPSSLILVGIGILGIVCWHIRLKRTQEREALK